MEDWIKAHLSACLGFDVPDDLIQYITSIGSGRELENYLKTLLDFDNPQHRSFASELLKKKEAGSNGSSSKSKGKKDSAKTQQQQHQQNQQIEKPPEASGKKKSKFVNLYSQEGKSRDIVLLKGRHRCECQATRHKLINNCLKCGRIICQQEGSGPCLFCGDLVCSREEQQLLTMTTKKSSALYNKLMEQKRPQGWEAALAERNRLLEYDRTSESRTKVTDDDSDYFNSGSVWLSKTEREKFEKYKKELEEKKHASRLDKKMTLDFAGRQILEDKTFEGEPDEEAISELMKKTGLSNTNPGHDVDGGIHPDVNFIPEFDYSVTAQDVGKAGKRLDLQMLSIPRVQDAGLQLMADAGKCLSMHQPWASLLVAGIKIHEGRTWYTSHRGRLWIASTIQQPDTETIRTLEHFYNVLYKDDNIKFPESYPTGCLLGCVIVEDCLAQEDYREKYPEGESDSPFVLICSDPISLPLRFPIKGKHKIYPLDTTIHQAAVKMVFK